MYKIADFKDECEIQQWIYKELSDHGRLDHLIEIEESASVNNIPDYWANRLSHSINTSLKALRKTQILSQNEDISILKGEILKPDFVLFASEMESIAILELKKTKRTSREAGTELGAYSSEIRSLIPLISDGDLVHVIISFEWSTLLLHYVRHQIIWQRRNMICLQPIINEDGENKLRALTVGELSEKPDFERLSQVCLGTLQMPLFEMRLGEDPTPQIKAALQAMATTGERLNSHGFAYLWRETSDDVAAEYSITICNYAPLKSLERFFRGHEDRPQIVDVWTNIVKNFGHGGHGNTMNEICNSGKKLLSSICSPELTGYCSWVEQRDEKIKYGAEKIAFVGWGLFGDMLIEKLNSAYSHGRYGIQISDPELGDEVIGDLVVEDPAHKNLHQLDIK